MDENTQYWIMKGGVRIGPITFDELVRNVASPITPVWRQGLPDWVNAENLPELAGFFRVAPAPAVQPSYEAQPFPSAAEPMPPTHLAWSIIAMILCCIPTGIVALVYSSKVSSRWSAGNFEGARRASESASLWIIITIVCGLISIPFQLFFALLS